MSGISVPELLLVALLVTGFLIWIWGLVAAARNRSLLAFVLVLISGPFGALVYLLIVVTAPPPPPPPGPPPGPHP